MKPRIVFYERAFCVITVIALILTLVGCDALTLETKTVIDYRYTPAHEYDYTSGDNVLRGYEPECYELLWKYTYADGHSERNWETCTRFEYQNAKKDLGDIDDNLDGESDKRYEMLLEYPFLYQGGNATKDLGDIDDNLGGELDD